MAGKTKKYRIMEAAESLFATNGYAATSIRDIVAAADANLAAVNYYFGSKEALFFAILDRRFKKLNEDRLTRLKELGSSGHAEVVVEEIVEAFLLPIVTMQTTESNYFQFSMLMGKAMAENPQMHSLIYDRFFKAPCNMFTAALKQALPRLSWEDIYWRFHFMVCTMLGTLTAPDRLELISGQRCSASDVEEMIQRLKCFVTAGIKEE